MWGPADVEDRFVHAGIGCECGADFACAIGDGHEVLGLASGGFQERSRIATRSGECTRHPAAQLGAGEVNKGVATVAVELDPIEAWDGESRPHPPRGHAAWPVVLAE
jgi:hypothetical protein